MKKYISLLLAIASIFILCSCNKKADTNPTEPETTEKPVISDVYNDDDLPEKRYFTGSDGKVNKIVEYKYDKAGNIIYEKSTDGEGNFDSLVKYSYKKYGEDYKEVKKAIYKDSETVDYYFTNYEYKKYASEDYVQYCIISYEKYWADDTLAEKFIYTYDDDGNVLKMCTYDKDGNKMSETQLK